MNNRSSIPTALQIVAVLFLLCGIISVIEVIVRLASGSIKIDFGILGIPTYFGLRRFSTGWRTFALVCIWVWIIVCLLFLAIGIFRSTPIDFRFFGIRMGQIAPIWLSVASVPLFLLELWQYRVLTRPDIRALFFAA